MLTSSDLQDISIALALKRGYISTGKIKKKS